MTKTAYAKGTKLPKLKTKARYSSVWARPAEIKNGNEWSTAPKNSSIYNEMYSYGTRTIGGELCVLCEVQHYFGENYFIIPVSEFVVKKSLTFSLPEKWCFRPADVEVQRNAIRKWINDNGDYRYSPGMEDLFFWHYPAYDPCDHCSDTQVKGYTSITWAQFKNQVKPYKASELKMKKTKTMKKKRQIIGYIFKPGFEKFETAALKLAGITKFNSSDYPRDYIFANYSEIYNRILEAGVLNEWFNPVYKKESSLPKVGDWLYILGTGGNCGRSASIKKGQCYQIKSIQNVKSGGELIDVNAKMTDGAVLRLASYDSYVGFFEKLYRTATPKEIEDNQRIKIGGYPVSIDGDLVTIHGVHYTKGQLLVLQKIMNGGQVKSLNVGCQGQYQVDKDILSAILSKFK